MKKILSLVLIFILIIPPAYAANSPLSITTTYKTTNLDVGVFDLDGTLYLPLADISEALGSVVFETKGDYPGYYIITRSGDIIKHYAWTQYYEKNGEIKYIPSLSLNDGNCGILVPHTMIEDVFYTPLSYGADGISITAQMTTNYYTEIISKILNKSASDDFFAENFKRYFTYACLNPYYNAETVIKNVNMGFDKKNFDDAVLAADTDSVTVLVNKLNYLPEKFTPKNLVAVNSAYSKSASRQHYLNSEAYIKYAEMYGAAAKEGCYLKIVSSYRTEDYQKGLYNSYLSSNGFAYAEKYSARPGYSEHQTGLAVDINSLYTSFEKSNEYKWLKSHAHEYGFIERYPKGMEYITGYSYEPWHYRYVGLDAAKIIHEKAITYEEYYATYVHKSPYFINAEHTKSNVLNYYHK